MVVTIVLNVNEWKTPKTKLVTATAGQSQSCHEAAAAAQQALVKTLGPDSGPGQVTITSVTVA